MTSGRSRGGSGGRRRTRGGREISAKGSDVGRICRDGIHIVRYKKIDEVCTLASIFIDLLAKLNFEKAVVVFQVKLTGHTDSLKDSLVFQQIRTKLMPESCRKDLESL